MNPLEPAPIAITAVLTVTSAFWTWLKKQFGACGQGHMHLPPIDLVVRGSVCQSRAKAILGHGGPLIRND